MNIVRQLNRQSPAGIGLILLALIGAACQGGELPAIRIGLLPDESTQSLLSRFEPMRTRLENTLQRPVKVMIPSLERWYSYKDLVDAFAEGRIDIAYFGGATFLAASDRTPTVPLVMRKLDCRFRSYFITRAGSKAISLEDLKGMRFTFGAEVSTSGYLMPLYYLKELGIDPDKHFQGAQFMLPCRTVGATFDASVDVIDPC